MSLCTCDVSSRVVWNFKTFWKPCSWSGDCLCFGWYLTTMHVLCTLSAADFAFFQVPFISISCSVTPSLRSLLTWGQKVKTLATYCRSWSGRWRYYSWIMMGVYEQYSHIFILKSLDLSKTPILVCLKCDAICHENRIVVIVSIPALLCSRVLLKFANQCNWSGTTFVFQCVAFLWKQNYNYTANSCLFWNEIHVCVF